MLKLKNNILYPNNTERIVRDGLVLWLDGMNDNSYPGSGTAWSDLSGNGNTASLINGPTFDTAVGGNIKYDGSNDYTDFYAPSLGNVATVEMWVKYNSGSMWFGWDKYNVFRSGGGNWLGFNTDNGDGWGLNGTQINDLEIVGNWKHFVFVMRTDVPYTNNKIYVNGVEQTLSQVSGSENATNRNFGAGKGRICGFRASVTYFCDQNVAIFRVYNRELTSTEVLQNYYADWGRFGWNSLVTSGLVLNLNAADPNSYFGTTAWNDLTGTSSNFYLYNSPTYSNYKITFDGVNEYAIGGTTSVLDFDGTKNFSICCFAKTNAIGSTQVLISRFNLSVVGSYRMQIEPSGTTAFYREASPNNPASTSTSLIAGSIYYLCGTFDGSNLRIYTNCVIGDTEASTGSVTANSTLDVMVGAVRSLGSPTSYFNGDIYNVQIYNKALSLPEMIQNYQYLKQWIS